VGLGIPLVLFAATLVFHLVGKVKVSTHSGTVLSAVAAGLAVVGCGFWAFFSFLVFGRLWKVFDTVSSRDKVWEFLEGSYLFIGVGISLVAALGVFYFIFTGDFARSLFIFGLSAALFIFEALRFRTRVEATAGHYF